MLNKKAQHAKITKHHLKPLQAAMRSLFLGAALVAAQIPFIQSAQAETAAAAKQTFNIPAGSLSKVLSQFAAESGVLLSADAALAEGKSSKGLQGSYNVEDGFAALLQDSGLAATKNTGGDYKIQKSASVAKAETETLPEVQVKNQRENAYKPTKSNFGTKTDTELRDVPQTINVVDKEVLEDRGIIKLNQALETVPGVQATTGYGGLGSGSGYVIRGFLSDTEYRDGHRDFGFVSPREISAYERIEVLKGPASVLYGNNSPGGIVNYVTKRPKFEDERSLTLTYGSFQAKRGVLDMTGSLNDADTVAYRLVTTLDDRESHRDFVESDTQMFAPSLLFKFNDNTQLTLMAEILRHDYTFERGFNAEPEFFKLPRDRFLEEPKLNYADTKSTRLFAELKHQFNDNWSGLVTASYLKPEIEKLNFYPGGLDADRRTLFRDLDYSQEYSKNTALQLELTGKFNALGVQHTLLTGLEYYRSNFEYTFAPFGLSAPIDIFNPQYGQVVIPPGFLDQVGFGANYGSKTLGLFVQDQITFNEKWKMTAGLRYDSSRLFNDDLVDPTLSATKQTEKRFSPRIGFVYQPQASTAIFAGYSTSFNPQIFIRQIDGGLVKPEVGEQFELGWREDWLGGKLSSTLSVYEIKKENVSTTDPVNPLFQIQVGEQRSRGAELEVQGEVLSGLNATFSMSVIDAEVTKDNNIPVGDSLDTYAKFSSSLWLKYQPNKIGWFAGGGVFYTGKRETQLPNNGLKFPTQTVFDGLLGYNAGKWQTQLNLRNITDEETYIPNFVFIPGAGRSADLSLKVNF